MTIRIYLRYKRFHYLIWKFYYVKDENALKFFNEHKWDMKLLIAAHLKVLLSENSFDNKAIEYGYRLSDEK